MSGSDELFNRVRLSAREHFICHLLLIKMTEGKMKSKMIFAAFYMTRRSSSQQRPVIKSHTYALIKKKMSEAASSGLRGIKRSEETKNKISASKLGKKRTEAQRKQMSIAHFGKKIPQEVLDRRSQTVRGSTRSEETKKKMSDARKLYWERKRLAINQLCF
jgi:hypothetical protein